jgi:2-iminobutanoate/2-iminopropanoate deaminase
MSKQPIVVKDLSPPIGPFSPAIRGEGSIYISGHVAQDPATGKLVTGDVVVQTEQLLTNIGKVLEAAGKTFNDVLRVAVYLTRMEDFAAMNGVYTRFFSAPYPARTAVSVVALPLGACVEMDMVVQ